MELEEVRIEHGIGVHVPYIKKYCPQAKLLGICIGETRDLTDLVTAATQITEVIHKYSKEDQVLYVASIDFSHYLSYDEALRSDAYSEKLLLEHDAVGMSKLNDHYIDSPSTYGLLMKLLDQRLNCSENERSDCLDVQIIEKGNSELFSPIKKLGETTSYFFVCYGKK